MPTTTQRNGNSPETLPYSHGASCPRAGVPCWTHTLCAAGWARGDPRVWFPSEAPKALRCPQGCGLRNSQEPGVAPSDSGHTASSDGQQGPRRDWGALLHLEYLGRAPWTKSPGSHKAEETPRVWSLSCDPNSVSLDQEQSIWGVADVVLNTYEASRKTKPFSETTELESSKIFGSPAPPAPCSSPASVLCLQQRGAGRPRPRPFSSGGVQGARVHDPSAPVVPVGLSGQSGDFNRNADFSAGGWMSRSRRLVRSPFLVTSWLPSH